MLGITPETVYDMPDLDAWLKDRASLTQVIQMQLQRAPSFELKHMVINGVY